MEELYFSKKIENILLLVNKNLSFDKNLKGDFNLKKHRHGDQAAAGAARRVVLTARCRALSLFCYIG